MAKGKRYSVWVKVPILNTWMCIAADVSKTEANTYEKTAIWETRVKENERND